MVIKAIGYFAKETRRAGRVGLVMVSLQVNITIFVQKITLCA